MKPFTTLLRDRCRTAGAEPLLTYYDVAGAERTELSATTFANWVDKTSNLLNDEFALAPGDAVSIDLAIDHPGHWVTLVWVAALWQLETVVVIPGSTSVHAADPVLEVIGPERTHEPSGLIPRLAARLHPLGLGFDVALPDDVVDYAAEVRGQADRFVGTPPRPEALAWVDVDRELTQQQLLAELGSDIADQSSAGSSAGSSADSSAGHTRRTVVPGRAWVTVREALIRPVATGGSAVIVRGATEADLRRIAAAERARPS